MPNLIIKKVEQFGKTNANPNVFDALDSKGVLFEWNDKVDECPEGIVKEDMVLCPFLAAEILGIVLNQDQPNPLMEVEIEPQGRTKDIAVCNVNIEPFNVAGVDALTIVHANNDKINKIDDNNNNFTSITTISPANSPNSLILLDTLDNNNANEKKGKSSNNDKSSNINLLQRGNLGTQGEIGADAPEEDLTEGQDQGVHQSRCKNKGTTGKYADYSLMLNAWWQARGGQCHHP